MASFDYDLLVIGAGSAGLSAAQTAAKCGARVAIADPGPLGGHLRQPGMHSQKANGVCQQPCPRKVSGH